MPTQIDHEADADGEAGDEEDEVEQPEREGQDVEQRCPARSAAARTTPKNRVSAESFK